MEKIQRFKLPKQGMFQILNKREINSICIHEQSPPGMPDVLFIKRGWSIKNRESLTRAQLHSRLRSSMAANLN